MDYEKLLAEFENEHLTAQPRACPHTYSTKMGIFEERISPDE